MKAWKAKEVTRIKELVSSGSVIGVVDLRQMPSAQLQEMRKKLRGRAAITVTKTSLMRRALEGNAQAEKLLPTMEDVPCGLIVTSENPFKIYNFIKNSKSRSTAKPGMVAPADIWVSAQETDLPPGPVLSDLKQAKIDAKMDKGKVVIASDSLVAKKGDTITLAMASALAKLGVTPIEISLRIPVMVESGVAYASDVLSIDAAEFLGRLVGGYNSAVNLSVFAGYPTTVSIKLMIAKASRNARAVSLEAGIVTKDTVKDIIGRASRQATALSSKVKSG